MKSPIHVTDAEFDNLVLKSDVPVLVDFWAPWCAPCRMLAPSLDRIAEDYAGRMAVAKVNVDQNPENAVRFRVRSIPTLLFMRQGKLVYALTGVVQYEALKRLVEEHLGISPAEAA